MPNYTPKPLLKTCNVKTQRLDYQLITKTTIKYNFKCLLSENYRHCLTQFEPVGMVITEIKVELEWFAVVTVIVAFVAVGISTIESKVVCWTVSDVVAAGVVVFVKVVVVVVVLGWGKVVVLVVVAVVVATVVVVVIVVNVVVVVVVVVVVAAVVVANVVVVVVDIVVVAVDVDVTKKYFSFVY